MQIVGLLLITLLLAFMVETLVEFLFGELFSHIPALLPHKWLLMYIAIGAAIGMAFFYQLDLPFLLAQFLEVEWEPLSCVSWPGMLASGIAIGKGSNYLHDLIKKFFVKPSSPQDMPELDTID
jgi:hypothetical protein